MFTLTLMGETVTLDPGKLWVKVDVHKWVTRDLMEAPPSFRVLANGAVEINGEKIALEDANDGDGVAAMLPADDVGAGVERGQIAARRAEQREQGFARIGN